MYINDQLVVSAALEGPFDSGIGWCGMTVPEWEFRLYDEEGTELDMFLLLEWDRVVVLARQLDRDGVRVSGLELDSLTHG